jgi:molybdopterin-guanine dinucleotide biosynthesis protein B
LRVIAFSGPSGSGKTTLILKLIDILQPTYNVSVIKSDPKNKASFDTKGKDSYKFFESGADVIVSSSKKVTHFSHKRENFNSLLSKCKNSDFIFVEGLKYLQLPRIGVFRNTYENSYTPYLDSVAISNINNDELKKQLSNSNHYNNKNIDILDLDNIEQIISWIYNNSKPYKQNIQTNTKD